MKKLLFTLIIFVLLVGCTSPKESTNDNQTDEKVNEPSQNSDSDKTPEVKEPEVKEPEVKEPESKEDEVKPVEGIKVPEENSPATSIVDIIKPNHSITLPEGLIKEIYGKTAVYFSPDKNVFYTITQVDVGANKDLTNTLNLTLTELQKDLKASTYVDFKSVGFESQKDTTLNNLAMKSINAKMTTDSGLIPTTMAVTNLDNQGTLFTGFAIDETKYSGTPIYQEVFYILKSIEVKK